MLKKIKSHFTTTLILHNHNIDIDIDDIANCDHGTSFLSLLTNIMSTNKPTSVEYSTTMIETSISSVVADHMDVTLYLSYFTVSLKIVMVTNCT